VIPIGAVITCIFMLILILSVHTTPSYFSVLGARQSITTVQTGPVRWWRWEFQDAARYSNLSSIAPASWDSDHMAVFTIGSDGSVSCKAWTGESGWVVSQVAPAASSASPGRLSALGLAQPPTSVTPAYYGWAVYWIGPDGSVRGAQWLTTAQAWSVVTIAPSGSARPGGAIAAAIGAGITDIHIFWINSLHVHRARPSWSTWKIDRVDTGDSGTMASDLKAVSTPRQREAGLPKWYDIDLILGLYGGGLANMHWDVRRDIVGFGSIPHTGSYDGKGDLAVLSKYPGSIEVFWVTVNGSVMDVWYAGDPEAHVPESWQPAYGISGQSKAVGPGIACVSADEASMDVWWATSGGGVTYAHWEHDPSWKRYTLAPPGSVEMGTRFAAVSRSSQHLEVWHPIKSGDLMDYYN